jgi:hypothetical protein
MYYLISIHDENDKKNERTLAGEAYDKYEAKQLIEELYERFYRNEVRPDPGSDGLVQ